MSNPLPVVADAKAAVEAEINSYGAQLLPGTSAKMSPVLGQMYKGLGPDGIADGVAGWLAAEGARYRNSEHKPVEGKSPFRRTFERVAAGRVKSASVGILHDALAADLADHAPETLPGAILRKLADNSMRAHLIDPPPLSGQARILRDALAADFSRDVPDGLDEAALRLHRQVPDLWRSKPHELTRSIARALTSSLVASRVGIDPIGADDRRLRVQLPTADPAAKADRGRRVGI